MVNKLAKSYKKEKTMGKKFNFDFTPFTFDELREMTQQELSQQIQRFRRMIKEASASGRDTLPFETEYCYLDHEKQTRFKSRTRRQ